MEYTHYIFQPDKTECQAIFIASCVETAALSEGMHPSDMYERMQRVNLIEEYILPSYEVLHAESRQNVTRDILNTLKIWENKKYGK